MQNFTAKPTLLDRLLSRRRFVQGATAAGALAVFSGTAAFDAHGVAAQASGPLIANDAATANPELVATDLQIPTGFDVQARKVNLPKGFAISLLAAGIKTPRFMAFDAAGNLLVAGMGDDAVYHYPAAEGAIAPAAKPPAPLISGLNAPSNVAFFETDGTTYLYVGETTQVSRYAYDAKGALGKQEVVIPDLPAQGHMTRTVAFGTDGKLYLSIGSSCNICTEQDDRRAAINRYNPDGSDHEIFAHGLRNAVGLAFRPGTDELWATVNERDNQGNEIPPDLVTIVHEGANYGWPTCQPPDAKPQESGDVCSGITPPTIAIQAHSAPLGLAFYTGNRFPQTYRGGIFVAQHGSWNRQPPAPPQLISIAFADGKPTGVKDFATGWQDENGKRWGRLAGVVVAPDGSLIVSDDTANLLYHITYTG